MTRWGVWCTPHQRIGSCAAWLQWPRGLASGGGSKRFEGSEAEARCVAAESVCEGWTYEAREIREPAPLPTEAGHYELTPSGEWRKVESGK